VGAAASHFDDAGGLGEIFACREGVEGCEDGFAIDFRDDSAGTAGQDNVLALAGVVGMAGEVGVLAFEAMNDAGFDQGVDGAIDADRG